MKVPPLTVVKCSRDCAKFLGVYNPLERNLLKRISPEWLARQSGPVIAVIPHTSPVPDCGHVVLVDRYIVADPIGEGATKRN